MLKLISQFDSYNDRPGVATPSGGKCCCCSCCCCLITATTARLMEVRYFSGLQKKFESGTLTEEEKIHIKETLKKPDPLFYSFVFHGIMVFQLILGSIVTLGLIFSTFGEKIDVSIVFALFIFYAVIGLIFASMKRRSLHEEMSNYGRKRLSIGKMLFNILALIIAGFIEIWVFAVILQALRYL